MYLWLAKNERSVHPAKQTMALFPLLYAFASQHCIPYSTQEAVLTLTNDTTAEDLILQRLDVRILEPYDIEHPSALQNVVPPSVRFLRIWMPDTRPLSVVLQSCDRMKNVKGVMFYIAHTDKLDDTLVRLGALLHQQRRCLGLLIDTVRSNGNDGPVSYERYQWIEDGLYDDVQYNYGRGHDTSVMDLSLSSAERETSTIPMKDNNKRVTL